MKQARALGYDAVEFDVKLSADGVAMLMHDDTLERTTNGRGAFRERTAAELAQLDAGAWRGPAFVGEPIPRFDDVMGYLNSQRMLANIEIKPCAGRDVETGRVVAKLANELAVTGHPPLLSSFSVDALTAAAEAAPNLPRALLVEHYDASALDVALELQCVSVNCPWQDVTPAMLSKLHANGFRVMAFTVNDSAVAGSLFGLSLDGIFTDTLDAMAGSFPALRTSGNRTMVSTD
jgi:glycerophosphoryl diester phosphodiesterase